ncbi:MAG TPA: hypothetical protein DCE81_14790 [Cytophagales bacterium]|nr:hypothetical protein [Cytophagales bacterium]
MMRNQTILVYGSYGYTGQLVVEVCRAKKLSVILSGRNAESLRRQSEATGYPFEPVDTTNHTALTALLAKAAVVIHCAGPFRHTAQAMANACLETKTHYTDITGEYEVFEMLAGYDQKGKQTGITIMPGTGFDVVPSDCLAVHLKNRLPSATHLQLAFTAMGGGLSRGTKKSMTEGLGSGGRIRQNGKLERIELGDKVLNIDFGPFQTPTLCIPWGDISTAWRSTGIPNIEVYTGATASMIKNAKLTRYLNWLLKMTWVKKFMLKKIDKQRPGPSQEKVEKGRSYLWGKAWDANGNKVESRLETVSGYKLTALTSVLIAQKILQGQFKVGYQTPAMAFGEALILEIEQTRISDL